uniref:Dihydrodipicolinate reductase n=1 Tax=Solanum tuberosum TaxID=4113 RepID=M1B4N6_SOLTU
MAVLSCQTYFINSKKIIKTKPFICCSSLSSQNNVKVIINGAAKEIGRAAVIAVTKARGMELAGAVDSNFVGQDIGQVNSIASFISIIHL